MSTIAWIFMSIAWGVVIITATVSMMKILKK